MNEQQIGENILIVDDKPANLRLLSQMLLEQGYAVRAVINGARALASARTDPPDLILLDIKMPEMDGYEVCRHLKAGERTRDIPIIFISALDETQDKVKAFAAGGVDYVTKPLQVEEVLARVNTHLNLCKLQNQLQKANDKLALRLDELEHYNTELQARNRELDAFAHTVAHDLKNPLFAVLLHASWMQGGWRRVPENNVQESLNLIVESGLRLSSIIDELLLLSSVRKEEVRMTPLDTANIVAQAQERLSNMIQESQAEIVLPEHPWPAAVGYAPWIEEVWVNYISNGIKYGGQPPRVELGFGEWRNSQIRFWVRDNGSGLSPKQQARLFTPFERLNQIRVQGHGLGLSIVRRIVEKLGGEVGVESKVGRGSIFYFALAGIDESGSELS